MLKLNNYYIQNIKSSKNLIGAIFVIIDGIYNEYIPENAKISTQGFSNTFR